MSEERNIEKQLRTWAGQRRGEAGGKLELHPATRQLLQGEVARVRGKHAEPDRSSEVDSLFIKVVRGSWSRMVWAGSAIGILAIGIGVALMVRQSPKLAEVAFNRQTTDDMQMAASLEQEEASGRLALSRGDGSTRSVAATAAPAESPVPASASYRLAKAADVGNETSAVENFFFRNHSVASTDGNQTADRLATTKSGELADEVKTKAEKAIKILSDFRLERNGDQIRIIGSDGSVYEGNLIAGGSMSEAGRARTEKDRSEPLSSTDLESRAFETVGKSLKSDEPSAESGQGLRFVVTGMNKTLNQNVVINGDLLLAVGAKPGQPTNAVSSFIQVGQVQSSLHASPPISNGRIIGRAVTADGYEVELNATQVSP